MLQSIVFLLIFFYNHNHNPNPQVSLQIHGLLGEWDRKDLRGTQTT